MPQTTTATELEAALELGVWERPFRDLIYATPPFVSDADDIAPIGRAMVDAIQEVHQ